MTAHFDANTPAGATSVVLTIATGLVATTLCKHALQRHTVATK